LKGKTVTLKLKNVNFEVKTRAQTLPYAVATVEEIFAVKELLIVQPDRKFRIKQTTLCSYMKMFLKPYRLRISLFDDVDSEKECK